MLILDRGPFPGAKLSAGLTRETNAFLADDFQVGKQPEVWVIHHIRLWAIPDPNTTSVPGPGDLFKTVELYGGLASDVPPLGQKPNGDCDCHNLSSLKKAFLEPGSATTDNPDVVVTSSSQHDGPETWQLDFQNLKWSVPGGKSIQFGILAEGRQNHAAASRFGWHYLASPGTGGDHLRIFSREGKLQRSFQEGGSARVNIQVWGHLLAKISIRTARQEFRVILQNQPFLKADQVEASSLRFGPGRALPAKVGVEDVDDNGQPALVMSFRASDSGLEPRSVNACLTGRRTDGAPFEGCDLLRH